MLPHKTQLRGNLFFLFATFTFSFLCHLRKLQKVKGQRTAQFTLGVYTFCRKSKYFF